jgi:hypothetical protein
MQGVLEAVVARISKKCAHEIHYAYLTVGLHISGPAPLRHMQVGCKKLKLRRSLAHKVESESRLKRLSKERRRLTR